MQRGRPLHPTLPSPTNESRSILIVAAGMGGGHNGAAAGLVRLLDAAGYEPRVVDLLEMMRFGYGHLINGFYHSQLRFAPWSYQYIYSAWRTHPTLVRSANGADTRAARSRLLDQVAAWRPNAIISAYNIGSQVLGELTASGELKVPAYSYVTDFGVHPYWIHESIAGYLTVHESSARRVAALSDAPVGVCGPLVGPSFHANPPCAEASHLELAAPEGDRNAIRGSFGFGDRDTVVLVVAGAWGVGQIEKTVEDLERIEGCRPLVVCGNNHRLARRLRRKARDPGHVLGFTQQMSELMECADLLVENAGGMTSSEAFASDLPVVTYRPIPGHGIDNANAMAASGVSTFAHDEDELVAAVQKLAPGSPGRDRQVELARKVFPSDPTSVVVDLISPDSDSREQTRPGSAG
ncbi:MAG: hypothetical protein WBA45_01110 [Microthrixaceae bacterium]